MINTIVNNHDLFRERWKRCSQTAQDCPANMLTCSCGPVQIVNLGASRSSRLIRFNAFFNREHLIFAMILHQKSYLLHSQHIGVMLKSRLLNCPASKDTYY